MIQKVIVFLSFTAIALALAVGVQAQTVRGEGKYISNTLAQLAPFKSVEVRGDVRVDIWQRDVQRVSIHGKSNLVELADIRVEGDTLVIDFKRPIRVRGEHALHVDIETNQLEAVTVRAHGRVHVRDGFKVPMFIVLATDQAYITGNWMKIDMLRIQANHKAEIDFENIQANKLELALFDKAQVELSGFAEQAKLINYGSEDLEAADLRVNQAHVQLNGSGDGDIFATQTLQAEAFGRGKIIYHGRPVLTKGGNVKQIRPAFKD